MITKDSDMNDIFYIADRYSFYIAEWKKENTEFSRWYLLAIILEDRAVINRLLSFIQSCQEDKGIDRFLKAVEKAEKEFNKDVRTDENRIKEAISELNISDSLKKLEKFQTFYEAMMSNELQEDEEMQEGLKEKARDFLDTFLDEKELFLELNKTFPLESEKYCKNFLKEFAQAEKRFRTYFHYWTGLTDILNEFKKWIYSSELIEEQKNIFWWFFETPASDKTKEKDMAISEGLFNLISGINLKAAMTPECLTCPEQDDLIAFSAGELSYEAECQIRAHLLICEECARENVFLESIMQEPVVFPETAVLIPGAVTEALERELSQLYGDSDDLIGTDFSFSICSADKEIMEKLKFVIGDSYAEWALVIMDEDKKADNPRALIHAYGYRKNDNVIVLEESDKNSKELKNDIQLIKSGESYYLQVLIQNEKDIWIKYGEKIKPKENIPITIKYPGCDNFILLIDQDNEALDESMDIINKVLNNGEKDTVFSTTIIIVVEVTT